jgi:hypothetical protein
VKGKKRRPRRFRPRFIYRARHSSVTFEASKGRQRRKSCISLGELPGYYAGVLVALMDPRVGERGVMALRRCMRDRAGVSLDRDRRA